MLVPEFFQHVRIGGVAGLGFLGAGQLQLLKQHRAQLLGGIDIEGPPGKAGNQAFAVGNALGEHGTELPQLLLVDGHTGALHLIKYREKGYTETLFGRRRYLPELKSSNFNVRQGAERIALNTPIQGTAADLIKLAMIRVDKALKEQYPEANLLLQVHDELIVECPEEMAQGVAQVVQEQMEQVAHLNVPLVAEAKWGKSWYEAK